MGEPMRMLEILQLLYRNLPKNEWSRALVCRSAGLLPKTCFPSLVLTETYDGRKLYVSPANPSNRTVAFCGEYDKIDSSIVRALVRRGNSAIDIGANLGWYTTLISKSVGHGGKVISIEPLPEIFNLLKKNIEINKMDNCIPLNIAISDYIGKGEIHFFSGEPDTHSSLNTLGRSNYRKIMVQVDTVDNLCESYGLNPDFIKIDVEGAERELIQGASRTLRDTKPVLMIEFNLGTTSASGYDSRTLLQMIKEYDYRFYRGTKVGTIQRITNRTSLSFMQNLFCVSEDQERQLRRNLKVV